MLREQMHTRLETLKSELKAGETELTKVEKQRAYLHETMLRIGGAIQVLEELLAAEQPIEHPDGSNLGQTSPEPTKSEPAKTRSVGVRTDETSKRAT